MQQWIRRAWLVGALALVGACAPGTPAASSKPAPAAAPPAQSAPGAAQAPAAPAGQAGGQAQSGATSSAAGQAAAAPTAVAPLSPPVALKVGSTLTLGESPLYVAIEKGYFEAEGLNVEIVPFDSGANMIAPLAAGQLDAGGGATSAGLFNALARGVDIVIVSGAGFLGPGHDPSMWMVRKDVADGGQIRDYADWRGRTVAGGGEGNITTVAIGKALERGGLTFQDANVVNMGFGDMAAAFANGSLDVAFMAEPFVTGAAERNVAVRWRPVSEVLPNHMLTVWMYSRKLIQDQPEAGRRLMVGLMHGARDYMDGIVRNQGRAEVVAAQVEHTRVKDPALYDKMSFTGAYTSGEVSLDTLRHDMNWYQANGYLEAQPDLSRIVDTRFADYARQRLGPYPQ
jgi:NitT/TauT family transport system substrate-binding protein